MAENEPQTKAGRLSGGKTKSSAEFSIVVICSEPSDSDRERAQSASPPAITFQIKPPGSEPRTVRYTHAPAQAVAGSLARLHRRKGTPAGFYTTTTGAIGTAPKGLSSFPESSSEMGRALKVEENGDPNRDATKAAIILLRTADVVIAGPLSADHANTPGFLAHLADLGKRGYRALRPPREIIVHPGFAQIARRYNFIQMSQQDARALAGGASDLGILAQCLRSRQGPEGEFAITAFGDHGLLWADQRQWEIEPLGDKNVDEDAASAAFCTGWVVARRLLAASAPHALAYARTTAARVVRRAGGGGEW
jgi:hypothetical protein